MTSSRGEGSSQREQEGLTIFMLGKTGNGQSSVGNIILGHSAKRHFPVSVGMASSTVNTETCTTTRNGLPVKVIDIPDFINHDEDRDIIINDIVSKKRKVANKPYVILLAVRCDVRYTKKEYDIYKEFRELWGQNIYDHLIIAFTFGDRQDRDLRQELKTVNPELKSVLHDARQRYVVFNDKTDAKDKEKQAEQLMRTIMELERKDMAARKRPRKSTEGSHYGSTRHHNTTSETETEEANCFSVICCWCPQKRHSRRRQH